VIHQVLMLLYRIHTRHLHYMATQHIHILLPQLVVRRMVLLLNHIHTLHPPIYLYPPAQPVHSEDDDNLGNGDNTSHTTQALSRMNKRNEWTPTDEEKLVLLNFITSLSCMR
jgi:hypothetical protein